MAIPLGRPLPDASRDQPGRRAKTPVATARLPRRRARPYSVLLPVGFTVPRPSPAARCALTAPFHPCPRAVSGRAGGLLSVALSLGSPPPGVTRHRVSVEPGLSSPGTAEAGPGAAIRPSGRRENRRGICGPQGAGSPPSPGEGPANPFDSPVRGLSECRSRANSAGCRDGEIGRADRADWPWPRDRRRCR